MGRKKRIIILGSFLASLWSLPAWAGDIKGKVTVKGATSGDIVVWVEGVKGTVPRDKPQIAQHGAKFTPSFMVLVAGQTIDMPNDDKIAHNVFSPSKTKKFNLGIYPKGTAKSVTFDKVGVVDMFCSIHRQMKAKIVVVPNQYFSTTEPDKEFVIKNVPPDKYTLKFLYKKSEGSQSIVVTNNPLVVKLSL